MVWLKKSIEFAEMLACKVQQNFGVTSILRKLNKKSIKMECKWRIFKFMFLLYVQNCILISGVFISKKANEPFFFMLVGVWLF